MTAGELWDWFYKLGFKADGDPRKAAGIRAVKQELLFNGYDGGGIILDHPVFGANAVYATKAFQNDNALVADGVVGPNTMRRLVRKRVFQVEALKGIPDHLLAKLLNLESADDPVAEGVLDPDDEGIAQIHLSFHPEVSQQEADDPAFAIPWAAGYLRGLHTAVGYDDWDCTLAAYNIGTQLAREWCREGKPETGGPQIGTNPDGSPRLAWTTAHQYVTILRSRPF